MKTWMRVALAVPATLFALMGIGWLVKPEAVSPQLGMRLEEGVGLSSQIGDLAAFFLTLAACTLTAVVTRKPFWLYPPIMLLGIAAFGRIVAWLFHGAPFAMQMVAVELMVLSLLTLVVQRSEGR